MKRSQKLVRLPPLIGASKAAIHSVESYSDQLTNKNKWLITKAVNSFVRSLQYRDTNYFSGKLSSCDVPETPIFILGHWRSGTTFLHNLLCQDENASYISTYQSVFPNNLRSRFIFENFMKLMMPARRPADNVVLSTILPQEEEFALANMTNLAYYHFWYFPSHHQEFLENVDWQELNAQKQEELKICLTELYHKAWLSTGSGRLVVKNPVNLARIPLILDIFPNAKFLHIRRNSYDVYNSTKRFFSKIIESLCLEDYTEKQLENIIMKTYPILYSEFEKYSNLIPKDNLIEIDFSNLLKDPYLTIHTIYSNLSLEFHDQFADSLKTYCDNQRLSHKVKSYDFNPELAEKLKRQWGNYHIQR